MTAPDVRTPGGNPASAVQNQHADFAALGVNEQSSRDAVAALDKRFATLRTLLALAGFQLHVVDADTHSPAYMIVRWTWCRILPTLAAVEAFADHAGVSR